jgi:hypothetical protein
MFPKPLRDNQSWHLFPPKFHSLRPLARCVARPLRIFFFSQGPLLFAEITQRWTVLPHALEDDLSASISSCCGLVHDYPAMLVQSNQSCVPCRFRHCSRPCPLKHGRANKSRMTSLQMVDQRASHSALQLALQIVGQLALLRDRGRQRQKQIYIYIYI